MGDFKWLACVSDFLKPIAIILGMLGARAL